MSTQYRNKEATKVELINFGRNNEELEDMGKVELDEMLEFEQQQANANSNGEGDEMAEWDNLIEESESTEDTEEASSIAKDMVERPDITDFEWHDYAMAEFHPEELADGMPKVDGLRRVTEKFIGRIVQTHTEVIQVPTPDNGNRATVVYEMVIVPIDGSETLRLSDAADCFDGNTKKGKVAYAKHPVALATTRAEARVLRKLLRLRTVASEETAEDDIQMVDSKDSNRIDGTQIAAILMASKRCDIDTEKMLKRDFKIKVLMNATSEEGKSILKQLSVYQGDPETIPNAIKV